MSTECKKCKAKIVPLEITQPGAHSRFQCPVCGSDVSSGAGRGTLQLLVLFVIAFVSVMFYFHVIE